MGPWSRERERHGEIGSEGKKVRGRGVSNVWIGGKDGKERKQWKGEERGRGRREGREREGRTTLGFVRRFGWTVGSFSKTSSAARITKIKLSAEEEQTQDQKTQSANETEQPTFAALQSFHQLFLLDHLPPTHIDQNHSIFHLPKRCPSNHTFCFFCQWACQDDDV